MSDASSVDTILNQAREREKEYDWLGAAELYRKTLGLLSEDDFSRKGDIAERLGYAYYRAAFQAETNEEFRDKLHQSTVAYKKAVEFYRRPKESMKPARASRCNAMVAYIGYWLAQKALKKKRLLDDSWRSTKEALEASKKSGEAKEYGETYNQLSATALLESCLEWDYQAQRKIIKEVAEYGEKGVKLLSSIDAIDAFAKTCAKTAFTLSLFAYYFLDLEDKERCSRRAQAYWIKAKGASETSARLEMLSPVPCALDLLWGSGSEEAFTNLEKALEQSRTTKDKFIIGSALEWLTYHTLWKHIQTDDYDEVLKGERLVIQYAHEAKQQYSVIAFISPQADALWIEAIHAKVIPGYSRETNLEKRREMLEEAIRIGRNALKTAKASGYHAPIMYVHHELSVKLSMLAEIESRREEKRKLFEYALRHESEVCRIIERLAPLSYWDLGIQRGSLSYIKCELADLAADLETRKSMLQTAMLEGEKAMKLLVKEITCQPLKLVAGFAVLGNRQYDVGNWWIRLYRLTGDKDHLKKAAEVFIDALESYHKVNRISRMAECHWKIAQTHDELDHHLTAAKDFCLASDNFKSAAEKIPQLKSLYGDYALYLQAWSEIEKARYHHEKQEYNIAKEHFDRASRIHRSLKQWSYLAPNYAAWAQLEQAEELSRNEQSEKARGSLEEAARLFDETKGSIQSQVEKIENNDEKQMATNMLKATDTRREYCEARIAVEEAKLLDKKGDHYSSSEKYSAAAEMFEKASRALESEPEQKEFRLIIALSRAWQKMTLAEARSSPALYLEASQIFEQAEELSPNEKAKLLILGHSRFCKALAAGTRFTDSRSASLHEIVEQHLESAADYYMRAGFQNASEYSKAMEHMFDAYLYMDDAKREKDPEKKAKLYTMAEKVLQTSAGSFMKAKHPEKKEHVQRMLEKVKEERELAISLSEVLHAPLIVSTTTAFTAPTPIQEKAVGLEKFEHADVHANIMVSRNELNVGENLEVEIELANAGKGTALLDRIEGAIPNGFEIAEKLHACRIEGGNVNMKGRRLEQLKGEDVKFSLRPKHKGLFTLKPVILYIDEKGSSKSHEPEPVTITVKELGIKGWLKGER